MSKKTDTDEVSKRLSRKVRQVEHGIGYYLSLFLIFFAIPLYVLLQFFYVYAGGWQLFDVIFLLFLVAVAVNGIYKEYISRK